MVTRDQRNRDLVLVRSLSLGISGRTEVYGRTTYPWISNCSWCLHLHDLLHKFDAAYTDPRSSSVPSFEYIQFDSSHVIPCLYVSWVGNAVKT